MSDRENWMEFIRNEYDPCPDLGKGAYPAFASEWDDGAGRIADAILAMRTIMERKHADEIDRLTARICELDNGAQPIGI
jgi:hypothetical protein